MAPHPPALAQTPDPTTLYRSAYEAYNAGDLPTAHTLFARLVQLAPQISLAHTAYGEVLLAQGDATGALTQLQLAQQLDPKSPTTQIALANTWLALNNPAQAAQAFTAATTNGATLTPEDSTAYATALASQNEPDQAIAVVQAAATAPNLAPTQQATLEDTWGALLAQQGRFDQATQHFSAAIQADPNLAGAHAHLGSALLATHQPEPAVAELRQAVALAPTQPTYATELGRALTASGQNSEAIPILRNAVALATQPAAKTQANYALALALQARAQPGDLEAALPLFAATLAATPNDPATLTNYALALVQTGDAKHALTLYQQALDHGPDNATLRQDYGVAYLQQNDLDHALVQFRAGLALEPQNPHLHYDLGLAYKLQDNLSAATPEFERAEQLDPSLPDPPYTLGVLHMQQGEFAAAAAELEKTVALQPSNSAAWAVLGNVYKENAEPTKAVAALKQAIALDPTQPSTHISLAAILAQQGDRAAAAAERKQAADLSRAAVAKQRASFALKSGQALLAQGHLKEAEAQLRTAIAADPEDPSPHSALADALAREGQPADAAIERQLAAKLQAGVAPHK